MGGQVATSTWKQARTLTLTGSLQTQVYILPHHCFSICARTLARSLTPWRQLRLCELLWRR
mgnify:CR=1 FL=1